MMPQIRTLLSRFQHAVGKESSSTDLPDELLGLGALFEAHQYCRGHYSRLRCRRVKPYNVSKYFSPEIYIGWYPYFLTIVFSNTCFSADLILYGKRRVGVFRLLCLLAIHSMPPLKFLQLGSVAITFGHGASDDESIMAFSFNLSERFREKSNFD